MSAELSPRETQVLHLVAWGHTSQQVATQLALNVKTTEAHRANAMRKLGLSDRAELTRYAVLHGWFLEARASRSHGSDDSASHP